MENKYIIDLDGEIKEVKVRERLITIKEYWAQAVDGSFCLTIPLQDLFDTPEEAEKSRK